MQLKGPFSLYLQDILNLFYPIFCTSCGRQSQKVFEVFCLSCESALTKTNYHNFKDNPLEKKFWGRCDIERATALYFFEKKGPIQKILYQLKYKGNQSLGRHLGKLLGTEISSWEYSKATSIIPVPLHPKKEKLRGYNQVQSFAEGLSETLKIPIDNKTLRRIVENPSQTGMNRIKRWENVDGIFKVELKKNIAGKHIILIDDVVTTGATIEACMHALKENDVKKVSLVCIAVAH